jgi:hypothetical protein
MGGFNDEVNMVTYFNRTPISSSIVGALGVQRSKAKTLRGVLSNEDYIRFVLLQTFYADMGEWVGRNYFPRLHQKGMTYLPIFYPDEVSFDTLDASGKKTVSVAVPCELIDNMRLLHRCWRAHNLKSGESQILDLRGIRLENAYLQAVAILEAISDRVKGASPNVLLPLRVDPISALAKIDDPISGELHLIKLDNKIFERAKSGLGVAIQVRLDKKGLSYFGSSTTDCSLSPIPFKKEVDRPEPVLSADEEEQLSAFLYRLRMRKQERDDR